MVEPECTVPVMEGVRKAEWCPRRDGIAAHEESTLLNAK